MRHLILLATLVGCGTATAPTDTVPTPVAPGDCAYPSGALAPDRMALDGVLHPYSWPVARHLDGVRTAPLSLLEAHCDSATDIDWSPHDVLVFVSIPAW